MPVSGISTAAGSSERHRCVSEGHSVSPQPSSQTAAPTNRGLIAGIQPDEMRSRYAGSANNPSATAGSTADLVMTAASGPCR